jgi:hypothetical protein
MERRTVPETSSSEPKLSYKPHLEHIKDKASNTSHFPLEPQQARSTKILFKFNALNRAGLKRKVHPILHLPRERKNLPIG